MKNFMTLVAVSTLLLLSSCSGEERAWQDVKTRNTVSDFEQFIEAYPQSIFKDSAKNKILELQKSRINSNILDFFKEGRTSAGTIVAQYTIKDNKIAGISHYESGDKGISLSFEKNSDSIIPLCSGIMHLEQDLVIKTSEDEFKVVAGSAYLIHLNP